MAKIFSENLNKEIEIDDNTKIKDKCDSEFNLPFGCENGDCGTCMIEITEGMENLNERTEKEKNFDLWELKENQRLACQCIIKQGIVRINYF